MNIIYFISFYNDIIYHIMYDAHIKREERGVHIDK